MPSTHRKSRGTWRALLVYAQLHIASCLAHSELKSDYRAPSEPSGDNASQAPSRKPTNILFIIVDDVGWNDIAFHSSPAQVPTPNIDALADGGLRMDHYYTQPVCSPTRSSIMTGRHVIHTGIYTAFINGDNKRVNLTFPMLPEYLQKLGYRTHLVGKWHLGFNEVAYLPTSRGFDSAYGYWNGAEGYYNHTTKGNIGYDFADGVDTLYDVNGTYSTYLYTEKAIEILREEHDQGNPFFLYLAYQNVHWPLEAPDEFVDQFKHIENPQRRFVAAMLSILDEGVGNVTDTLKELGIYDDTMIVFVSDNGGPTHNNEGTQSNNFPLRGGKNTLWEGGVRVPCIMRGPGVLGDRISNEKMHVTDWLPSLLSMASGGNWTDLLDPDDPPFLLGDGMDVWKFISGEAATSPRQEVLHECNPLDQTRYWSREDPSDPSDGSGYHGDALIVGDWKIVHVELNAEPGWYPPPGQNPNRTSYSVACEPPPAVNATQCMSEYCLFHVATDPCEYHDLSSEHPDILESLHARLEEYRKNAVEMVTFEGCEAVINDRGAWRPCDAPP
mmetsp:Transcript_7249/g.26662  ORF Transcript_7249/g.26662 Transcript_7249/m.26662 type:complete len:555 (+) Transcript_7249:100-1764(+)